ncbi:hypothetical protein [Leifsonia sp. fls2-241-R2A-40a]|uniref:hypothetical protein n=1 Tax=Leifsonia sp. fls2-241-R2A-40a TaxID=3040290 RepID=UPI00254BD0BD|nr:hypothetical protein [Leifsonia sp. fls2-241-R2A-40a]
MSDTSGLPNTDAEGVPAEDQPERFEQGGQSGERDAQAAEPAETDPGQDGDDVSPGGVSAPGETGVTPEGAEDVTPAAGGTDQAEAPPADFDPADQPSNPDLVGHSEPPD